MIKKYLLHLSYIGFWLGISLMSCKEESIESDENIEPIEAKAKVNIINEVETKQCTREKFVRKTNVVGLIKATRKARIYAEATGILQKLYIDDGQKVGNGQLIGQLDQSEDVFALAQAKIRLDDATAKKNDRIIMDGGIAGVDTSVPPNKLKLTQILVGFNKVQQDIKEIEHRLGKKTIKSPFSGTVSLLKVKQYEMINMGQELFTLLDQSSYAAYFMLLEEQATKLSIGTIIKLHPMHDPSTVISGVVDMINPIVSEGGLVEIRARLGQHRARLFENMNIKVIIEQKPIQSIVVPKEALVRRSGREVVFTYIANTKTAKWNYVTVLGENDAYFAIGEGLKAGDEVIYRGNLNLDHDAKVTVKTNKQ